MSILDEMYQEALDYRQQLEQDQIDEVDELQMYCEALAALDISDEDYYPLPEDSDLSDAALSRLMLDLENMR